MSTPACVDLLGQFNNSYVPDYRFGPWLKCRYSRIGYLSLSALLIAKNFKGNNYTSS